MQMKPDFISGFLSAVHSLGQEGDRTGKDWSEPYAYLKGMLDKFEPEKPKEILGFKLVVSPTMPDGCLEFHHADGRVDAFHIAVSSLTPEKS